MILCPIFGGLKPKPVKAEKFRLPFDRYELFADFLTRSLADNGYSLLSTQLLDDNVSLIVFLRKKQHTWDCYTLIRIPELTENFLDETNDRITHILIEHNGNTQLTNTVNMTSIVCVDRITPAFQKLVNGNIQQGLKNGRLPVGITFGGKTIYVARQKDGFAVLHYKALRKEFLNIMHLQKSAK